MGVPYETKPKAGILIAGGQTKTELVNWPSRSFISKVVVVQTSGNIDGFTVELFNHVDAMEGTERSDSSSDSDGDKIPLDCYRVGSPMTTDDDKLLYFSDEATGGHGLQFYCQDVDRADRRGQKQPNLYMRITPSGSGAKTFAYCIGGESQIAGV